MNIKFNGCAFNLFSQISFCRQDANTKFGERRCVRQIKPQGGSMMVDEQSLM